MAARLPVLATDVCGYADHIERAGAGRLLSSPFRQTRLNEELATMLTSGHKEKWAQNGWRYVMQNDVFSMPEKAVDIIEGPSRC